MRRLTRRKTRTAAERPRGEERKGGREGGGGDRKIVSRGLKRQHAKRKNVRGGRQATECIKLARRA